MIVRRKFSLTRIGKNYETVDSEVETETVEQAMMLIEESWRTSCKAIVEGKIQ